MSDLIKPIRYYVFEKGEIEGPYETNEHRKGVILPATGLYDKRGTEAKIGDILQHEDHMGSWEDPRYVVNWGDYCACFGLHNRTGDLSKYDFERRDLCILGNVFTHPEEMPADFDIKSILTEEEMQQMSKSKWGAIRLSKMRGNIIRAGKRFEVRGMDKRAKWCDLEAERMLRDIILMDPDAEEQDDILDKIEEITRRKVKISGEIDWREE